MAARRSRSDPPPGILIVEDDREASTIYADYLESKGFRVLLTRDPVEGVRLAEREQPSLILMDLQLPQMSGSRAIRHLKGNASTSQIRILAITASSLQADQQEARDAGCDGFVEKPCRPQQLLQQIDALLGQSVKGPG